MWDTINQWNFVPILEIIWYNRPIKESKGDGEMSEKKEKRILAAILPLIVVLMLIVWGVKPRTGETTVMTSANGEWDLTSSGLMQKNVRVTGDVEYVPDALLTPQEFSGRTDICLGQPDNGTQYATSRMRLKVPRGSYLICGYSVDFASRMYVNGELLFEAGVPGENRETTTPGVKFYVLPVSPDENGEIVIVQQASNFTHKDSGTHGTLYIGLPEQINRYVLRNLCPEVVLMGCYLVLFIVHMVLYTMMQHYKPNLLFALFCLTWFIRTGVTGQRILGAVLPNLPWTVIFRLEYLTMPLSGILLVWLLYLLFPGVLQKWFPPAASILCGCFAAIDIFGPTLLMSYTAVWRVGILGLIGMYFFIRLIFQKQRPDTGQLAVLAGFAFLLFAALWDMLYHMDIHMLPALRFAVSEMSMAVFVLFAMTALFFGTMSEVRRAKEREERMAAEKEMMAEMNRMKNQFYTDMSHEMKTPLTVISVNAQFAAQNIGTGVVDEETVADLNAISTEARRLAQMVTSLVGLGRMQGTDSVCKRLDLESLIVETVRIYQSMFARQGNTLTAKTEPGLPPVEGSADQLVQVLINLLSNANRHTKNGTVLVRAEALEHQVRVSVADDGDGISRELLPHVFERFRRGDEGVTGLGLTICKTIIEGHGGQIGVQSEEGKGAEVWFTLPAKEVEHERDRDNPAGGGR